MVKSMRKISRAVKKANKTKYFTSKSVFEVLSTGKQKREKDES